MYMLICEKSNPPVSGRGDRVSGSVFVLRQAEGTSQCEKTRFPASKEAPPPLDIQGDGPPSKDACSSPLGPQ